MDYSKAKPADVRKLIREGKLSGQTSGMCDGYAQANLVILPKDVAYDFLLFCQRNPKPCPLLEVSDTGSRLLHTIAEGADIATDLPKYRVYKKGELVGEYTDVVEFWRDDFVSFLIGCSFSFEGDLLAADVPVSIIALVDVPICFMITRLIPSSIHPVVAREGGMAPDMAATVVVVMIGMMLVAFGLYRLRFRQARLQERMDALKEQLED